ncbi:MAG: hypothetical protein U5L96_16695 [Owenweeksia sp.]|nr:hypothetical protein [Owenweeksia sp.]
MDASIQQNSITNFDSAAIAAFGTIDSVEAQCNWYGSVNTAVVDAAIYGQVKYQDYLLDSTDNSSVLGFQPVPGACKSAICPDGSCDGCYTAEKFNDSITTGSSQASDVWYTDRYAPDSFYVDGSDSSLVHLIDAADGTNNRPGSFSSSFYDTQGRKYDLETGTTMLSIDLYVPSAWATTGRRMAGIWGTGIDAVSAISAYPIIEFVSDNGDPRFRGYEGDGSWIDMGLPL